MAESPFTSIESAHAFVKLLVGEVETAAAEIGAQLDEAASEGSLRRVDALRLVAYKLDQLTHHLGASSRILNDLRVLQRLLIT